MYSEKDHDNLECQSHQITTGTSNRICVPYQDKCFELYESCEKAESEEACKNNLPLTKNNKNEYIIYDWYKCVWNEGCTQEQRVCSDYKKPDNSYVPTTCRNFKAEKENSACFFDAENDKCEEVANSCENYNLIVEESKRTEEGCKSSYPEEGKKCALQNKQCKEANIECGDYTTKDECLKFNPGKDGKKCVFKNNLCVEDYEDCQTYNDLVSEADRKKADCESIYSYKSGYQMFKCVFSESKTCESKQVYKCSDYTGTDAEECASYPTDDKTHTCVYANNKCEEKINFVYNYCGDYVGEDKSICEAIKPRSDSDNTRIETNSKCVLEEEGGSLYCVKKQKQCSDAKDSVECSKIRVSNDKKRCFYIKGNCIEQYKTCEDYEAAEDVLEKETCESIVIANDDLNKCVFTAGVGGAKGTCKKTRKSCSDFNIGLISDKCVNLESYISESIFDHNDNTQCTFSDNVCKTELKSCLGLYETRDANEEVCKNANTSSNNVKCIFKGNSDYFSQCLEINDKEAQLKYVEKEETEKAETDGNTDAKTETDKNKDVDDDGEKDYSDNAREKYVNKILLILFAAMF